MKSEPVKKVHLIGNAHLDPVWLWQWQEGYAEIKATFQSALDRMKEFDDFIFTCGSIGQFEWVEHNCPEMFEDICTRVKEKRWQIVGGWWVQPDCNTPCGESFVRQALYSQRYLKDRFGFYASTGYNVDSFGHNCMIPQLLSKSHMNNYVFMRPGGPEPDIPDPLFLWEGPDGSQVLTFRILDDHYNNSFRTLDTVIQKTLAKDDINTDTIMLFYGVGNHGGGPTVKAIEMIHELQTQLNDDVLIFSSPDQFFNNVRLQNPDYPVHNNEIQHYASGCYATHFEFKKQMRHTEQLLLATERWQILSSRLTDSTAIPSTKMAANSTKTYDRLTEAWKSVLFNQFHDILGGCSIQDALADAEDGLAYARHIAGDILNHSLQQISWSVNTAIKGAKRSKEVSGRVWAFEDHPTPLIVFNPLPFSVKAAVSLDIIPSSIVDDEGRDIAYQTVFGRHLISNRNKGSIFVAEIPALGYVTYWLTMPEPKDRQEPSDSHMATMNDIVLENQWTRLKIDDKSGHIVSLTSKSRGHEHLIGPSANPLVMDDEPYDTWGHGGDTYNNIIGHFKTDKIEVIESGPVRSTVRVTSSYGQSQLRQDISLYEHSPDVEVRLRVNWQETYKILKLAFEVNTDQPTATYAIPYGHIERPCNGKEEPGQMWMDISDSHTGCGLALCCQARYSYSAQGHSMRLNVIRSPLFAEHEAPLARNENFEPMDQGIHHMTYKLVAHDTEWQASGIVEKALMLNNPLQKIHETYHEGPLPQRMENIIISNKQIVLVTMKASEDKEQDGVILRLYETYGQPGDTNVSIPLLNLDTKLYFTAYEIKTLLVDRTGNASEIDMIESFSNAINYDEKGEK